MTNIACVNAADSPHSIAETVRCIASGSLACVGIVVVDGPDAEPERAAIVEAAGTLAVAFVVWGSVRAELEARLHDSGAAGVLLISGGISVPYGLDVRLAKIAARNPSIATVSPFCDLSIVHCLRAPPAADVLDANGASRLDRLAFLLGHGEYFEVSGPLAECCFIPAAVIGRLGDAETHSAGGDLAWLSRLSAPGLVHVLAASAYVGAPPSATFPAAALPQHRTTPRLAQAKSAILEAFRAGVDFRSMPGLDARPVQLHVTHDMGGGSAKWLRDYSLADTERINLVLKSFSHDNAMGGGVALYTDIRDESPLAVWKFSNEIQATVAAHLEYRDTLDAVISEYCVGAVLVSSLIGHSLDALDTGLPTVLVNHDYFPYCPAINLHFGAVCRQCDDNRIGECFRENLQFNPFVTFTPPERVRVRHEFVERVTRPNVVMATPSRSVAENLLRLDARFNRATFVTIPHGHGRFATSPESAEMRMPERLRVLVLGQISVPKGLDLLRESLEALTAFAEVYLVGCRELGELFKFRRGVHVVSNYAIDELPGQVAAIRPHVGLLASICPETFSYALSELMMLGVPVAATRVGSFAERIRHLENGYLYEPDADSLVDMLKAVDRDRETLRGIRENLRAWQPRSAEAMVADYHRIVPLAPAQCARYPVRSGGPLARPPPAAEEAWPSPAMTIASMWKEVKSLHLQLSMSGEARLHGEAHFERERQVWRDRLGDAENALATQAESLAGMEAALATRNQSLAEKEGQVHALSAQLSAQGAQLAEILASTSWKVSRPVREIGTALRRLKILAGGIRFGLRDPATLPANAVKLFRVWRSGGLTEVKRVLLRVESGAGQQDAWQEYRETFRREVRPRLVRRIREMKKRPLVTIIVPTYNTPEPMLREMLASVRGQLYGNWELCVADDGSSQPHVKRLLEEYAAMDRRIRPQFAPENKGVSHASNRALEMTAGEFVVLLDHDDILEEQALFRVAESILEDDPDMVYSDEVLVTPDAATVKQYVFRPAFSPEFLRGHPYIVHLVGFRTLLLREIGGFDENLTISQDYDLILRATERARTVVHIPDILYRWRIHENSAGHQKMHEVMETSKAALQRHLSRCGEAGTIDDGVGFNLFDARYPLAPGLKVAIIIPTRNHGDLLRQCIESIRATVSGVRYDVVVVDHESDDADTRAYLSSISSNVRVLHHAGPFNFSSINNAAASQVGGEYSHFLFCNNDIEAIKPGWLERMLELGQRPSIGVVGAKLLYPDRRTIQHAGVCVGAYGRAEHYAKFLRLPEDRIEPGYLGGLVVNREVAAVTAACLLIRREAFEEVGGFDEALAVGFGDVDLCLRIGERGYRILHCPYAELVHHESYTRGTSPVDTHPADTALYRSKWQWLLDAGDPYFNPSLSLESTIWEIRRPLKCSVSVHRRIVNTDRQSGKQQISVSSPPPH